MTFGMCFSTLRGVKQSSLVMGSSIVPFKRPAVPPPPGFTLVLPVQQEIENAKFHTARGARFGDSPSTIEALYGKPGQVTRLDNRKDAVTLRFYYPSIRTVFQFDESAYGLLSVIVYAPGFSPETITGGR